MADVSDPLLLDEFAGVLSRFTAVERTADEGDNSTEDVPQPQLQQQVQHQKGKKTNGSDDDDDEDDDNEDGGEKGQMSNKAKRLAQRMSVAELKQQAARPDVVESWDATAKDPLLLVQLKAYRNTVPVPAHWSQKRKYLVNKRGTEKPPFELPDFIAATGISKLRGADVEDHHQKAKTKMRERMTPKMGRIDIDYQILHDAFFRFQTKPKMTAHGDIYYEGKEFEVAVRRTKPGTLSDELKRALGMPEGAPPPWLLNMQRYGPPPSYPNLKIPGLNSPIPAGARYGYHPGGWGKPPVDEYGRPLYGDVFGTAMTPGLQEAPVDRTRWGELLPEQDDADDDADDADAADAEDDDGDNDYDDGVPADAAAAAAGGVPDGLQTPTMGGGLQTPGGMSTPGIETPELINLRKQKKAAADDDSNKQLYQIIEQKSTAVGASLYGSSHTYNVPGSGGSAEPRRELKNKDAIVSHLGSRSKTAANAAGSASVDLPLDVAEVEHLEDMTEDMLKRKYEAALQNKKAATSEDVSDIVAEHAAKKAKKEASSSSSSSSSSSKDKDKSKKNNFKF